MSRGEKRKAAIAQVALAVFLERGFGTATMDDVAAAAGASKQTLYRFFGDRDGLVRHVLAAELEGLMAPLVVAAEGPGEAVASGADGAAARLEALAGAYQDMVFSPRALTLYRYVLGGIEEHPGLGVALTEVVTDRIVALVSVPLGDVSGLAGDALDARADAFLGVLQGKEFNRALAGYAPRAERLAALRAAAMAVARG